MIAQRLLLCDRIAWSSKRSLPSTGGAGANRKIASVKTPTSASTRRITGRHHRPRAWRITIVGDKVVGGNTLATPNTAVTLRGGERQIKDGPFKGTKSIV